MENLPYWQSCCDENPRAWMDVFSYLTQCGLPCDCQARVTMAMGQVINLKTKGRDTAAMARQIDKEWE